MHLIVMGYRGVKVLRAWAICHRGARRTRGVLSRGVLWPDCPGCCFPPTVSLVHQPTKLAGRVSRGLPATPAASGASSVSGRTATDCGFGGAIRGLTFPPREVPRLGCHDCEGRSDALELILGGLEGAQLSGAERTSVASEENQGACRLRCAASPQGSSMPPVRGAELAGSACCGHAGALAVCGSGACGVPRRGTSTDQSRSRATLTKASSAGE